MPSQLACFNVWSEYNYDVICIVNADKRTLIGGKIECVS